MNTSLFLKDGLVVEFCTFHSIISHESVSAGIMISKEIVVNLKEVFFYDLVLINDSEIIGPAIDLKLCDASVTRCCFAKCYGSLAGAYVIKCYCRIFHQNAFIFCGIKDDKINQHPSLFWNCLVEEQSHNNISRCGPEYFYIAGSQVRSIKYSTIADSLSNRIFYSHDCNVTNTYILSYAIRCKQCKTYGYGGFCSILIKDCYFIDSQTKAFADSDSSTFDHCFFTHTDEDIERLKGKAIVIDPQYITEKVVEYPMKAACMYMRTCDQKYRKTYPSLCLSFTLWLLTID